jgi:hypothetical protein
VLCGYGTIGDHKRGGAEGDDPVTAADWMAIAERVTAGSVLAGVLSWLWRQRETVSGWFSRRWRRMAKSVLSGEVTAGAAWQDVRQVPEVSMESGIVAV